MKNRITTAIVVDEDEIDDSRWRWRIDEMTDLKTVDCSVILLSFRVTVDRRRRRCSRRQSAISDSSDFVIS